MTKLATLPLWLAARERQFGSQRLACNHFGIDQKRWVALKSGEEDNPSPELLHKLGLRVAFVLYKKGPYPSGPDVERAKPSGETT